MDYILKETVTDIRYTANLKFTEKIGDSIRNGNFNINLVDTILSTNISINGSNFANYGITAPFTTKTTQIDDSLVNNGGIVVYLNNDYELNIIAIPMCICGDETIGFFSMNAEITFPAFGFIAKFLIKLCPTIVRNPVPEQLVESYEDPILPLRNDRVGKDYTPEYGINYPSTNIKYKTTDSLYVNTKTSGDHGFSAESGFSAEILKPDYPRVPCYVNHLRVYTIPYEFEPLTTFRYDWSTAKSYLFDSISNKKEDIVYDVTDIITSPESTIVVSSNGNDYKATFQYYDVKQYIFKDADGYFKNKLIFEISQWSKEPVAKSLHLIIEVTGGLTPEGGRSEAWPMEDDVYILDKDNPTWYGLVEVKNRNKDYFMLKPTTTWNPEQHPYKELGPYEDDQHDYDYETLYYLSGISADKDGSVRTIDINSYLNVSDNPDYTWEQMKRYTNADNTIKLKYVKTKLKRLKIFREPIVPDVLDYKNNKIDLKYTIENTDKDFYHSLDEYKTIIDEIIKADWSHTNNLDYNVFENPIISANDDFITITFSGINFSALNPGDVETNADINVSTWIADEDGANHISPDWNAAEVKEQTEISDYCSITYKKTKLNQLKISHRYGDNDNKLDYKHPTGDLEYTIENTNARHYGEEYVTNFDRILREEYSDNLILPEPITAIDGDNLKITYSGIAFSSLITGLSNLTTTADMGIAAWVDDPNGNNHISMEWNAVEVAEQTLADDYVTWEYTKTPLNRLKISATFGDNGNELDFRKPTTDISFIIENTDAGFYGTEYETSITRILNDQDWSKNLVIPSDPETTLSGDKLIVTYHDVGFSAIKPGVADEDLTTTAEGTGVAWIEDKDDDYHVSPDWNAFEVAQQTSAYTDLDLSYTKIKLPRLVIDEEKTITVPSNRQLAGAATGKVIYEVINTDENFYGNEYETISARLGHGLIETPLGGCHLYLPDPDVDQISGNRWRVTYDGLYFQDNYSGAIELQLSAAINDGTPHVSPDWSKDEVIYWTSAICSSETWAHNTDAIDPFTITYSLYSPSAGEDRIHWLAKDREGYLGVGSAHVVINNPNVNYRTSPSAVKFTYNLPRNASAENFDDSTYTTDGNISFDILGVEVDHENSATNAYIKSWGVFTAIGYDPAVIAELTTVEVESEWWKYKKVIPDIYPYDDFVQYSLYTLSDLEINGGKIGSKTVAARNVVCNNGAQLTCSMILAPGCSMTFNGANNGVSGDISAQYITIVNSPITLSGALYVSDSLNITDNITANTVYTGANCQVTLGNNSEIEDPHLWENPSFAEMNYIPTAEMVTTGTATARNGEEFGGYGTYTTAAYDVLSLGSNESVTFWPGKYYFNSINVDTDCTFIIHNDISTEEQDNSVMIFVNDARFADRLVLNEDCINALAFRLYYAGTNTMQFGVASQSDYGTLIAPNGTISLRNDAIWNGHIWAQKVELAQGAVVKNDGID